MKTHGNTGNAHKFGILMERTHGEIAEELGVTQQNVQQTEDRALIKFRDHFKIMFPEEWELIEKDIISGHFGREIMSVLQDPETIREMQG